MEIHTRANGDNTSIYMENSAYKLYSLLYILFALGTPITVFCLTSFNREAHGSIVLILRMYLVEFDNFKTRQLYRQVKWQHH